MPRHFDNQAIFRSTTQRLGLCRFGRGVAQRRVLLVEAVRRVC